MANIQVRVCDNCGAKLDPILSDGSRYGSPIRECPSCKRLYIDRSYREIAVDGFKEADLEQKSGLGYIVLSLLLALLSTGMFFLNCFGGFGNRVYFAIPVMAVIMWYWFAESLGTLIDVRTGKKQKELEKLRQESEERMRNRSYADVLVQHGYNVPQKYLGAESKR
jgi:hypothetical protein